MQESREAPRGLASVGGEAGHPPGLVRVLFIEIACILRTLILLASGKIRMPRDQVGRILAFGDGTTSKVYRETRLETGVLADPVLLVVRFRLRLLGTSPVGHALFRLESLFNTVLFAAHRGFATKLWLTDTATGFYRGVYEWEDPVSATVYGEVLRVVLNPWVEAGSFDYRIINGRDRESFLEGHVCGADTHAPDLWWLSIGMEGR